ncbi:GntR family transcriptional regulator [Roseiarcus sp.]|uniref:GntR family transcriptional regulator n=1 Tax=Roseiarcus sp. TaxID=1969460 RepID=UPI003C48B267
MSIAAASSKGTRARPRDAVTRRSGAALPAHGATVAYIVERLREEILAGRMAPGQRLVESDLTARFSVSRGPVREALRRLAADGLIDHWPNRGALVRRLSKREIGEFFQIRVELESLAARLAAESGDTAARARFAAAIRPILVDGPRRLPDYLSENAAFHEALLTLAGNCQLRDLSTRLHLPLIMAQVADILTPGVLEASVREHRAIAAAILERDAHAAANLMRAHLERAHTLALQRRGE